MIIEDDIKIMKQLSEDSDYEDAHYKADNIILKYLPIPIRELYEKVGKWYA